MKKNLYHIEFAFEATDTDADGNTEKVEGFSEVQTFEVPGGIKRAFWNRSDNGMGDADVMSEFYQVKQIQKLHIQKPINRSSLSIDRIFYRKLTFSFNLVVKSLADKARFWTLSVQANDARMEKKLVRDATREAFVISFSAPQVDYFRSMKEGSKTIVKAERL